MINKVYTWQEPLWAQVLAQLATQPHGVLLYGRQGIGKLDFALRLAAALLCEGSDPAPCGRCAGCTWFAAQSHPDLRVVVPEALQEEGASEEAGGERAGERKASRQITVEQVRELADFINVTTHRRGRRVVLVHPADAMNVNAQNALLKSLEEPPAGTTFILVTAKRHRLLATIRSRCRQLAMPAPEPEQARQWLAGQGIEQAEAGLAAAGYAPLQALRAGSPEVLAERGRLVRLLASRSVDPFALAAAMLSEGLQKAGHLLATGDSAGRGRGAREDLKRYALGTAVEWMQKWTYDLLACKLTGRIRYHPDHAAGLRTLAAALDARAVGAFHRRLLEFGQVTQHPLNAELFCEQVAIEYGRLMEGREELNHVAGS